MPSTSMIGHELLDLRGRDEVHGVDAERLVDRPLRLQPLPALGGAGDAHAAGQVQPARAPGLGLELGVEVDRVRLQRRDVRVGVERVEARRRVPRRARGELGALDEDEVGPAELGEVVEHARADDAAPDDDAAVVVAVDGLLLAHDGEAAVPVDDAAPAEGRQVDHLTAVRQVDGTGVASWSTPFSLAAMIRCR